MKIRKGERRAREERGERREERGERREERWERRFWASKMKNEKLGKTVYFFICHF